ncbi:MAG: ABC transporter [Myxococcota bacterium]
MLHVAAIFRREFAAYFGQPLAYIALTIFLVLLAFPTLFLQDVFAAEIASMRVPFFWTGVAFLFLIPAITMRLIAEEARTGSLELLSTLPITPTQLVLGKWLAAVSMVGVALLLTVSFPIALGMLGNLDPYTVIAGYLGMFLMGSAFAAVGLACSALTRFQVLAFLISFGIISMPYALGFALEAVDVQYLSFVQYLTFEYHFSNLARGVLDTRSFVFFGAIIAVALRIAVLVLQQKRLS